MEVKIITPHGLYVQSEATQINATSVDGDFGLLENHMPMVAMLQISRFEIVHDGDVKEYAISGGMLQFAANKAIVLTDSIEGEEEIDLQRAEEARVRAEKRLQNADSNLNMRRAEIALQKAINRIHVKQTKI
ncbi:MAG: ATP synthase F1 subunit epsilon [Breznakia sp.]